MRIIFTGAILFLLHFTTLTFGQNYSPLLLNNTSLFLSEDSYDNIEALHVDSITTDPKGDAHHFIKTWDNADDNLGCRNATRSTWAGAKCIVAGNTYYFFNEANDTITIKATNALSTPWKLYTYPNGNYIEAQFTTTTTLSFLGVTDFVKTLSMQLKNSVGNNITNAINTTILAMSENYGFTHTMNMLNFPTTINTYSLIGLSNPMLGEQALTPRTIFDYAIGDEFHYEKIQSNPPFGSYTNSKIKKIITSIYRSADTDTVIYTSDKTINTHSRHWSSGLESDSYTTTTLQEKYIFNDTTYYPNQAIQTKSTYSGYSHLGWFGQFATHTLKYDTDNKLTWENTGGEVSYNPVDDCWRFLIVDPQIYNTYWKGCGLYYRDASTSPGIDSEQLVYYKKGTDSWGIPLSVTASSKGDYKLSMFPNPLQGNQLLNMSTSNFNIRSVEVFNTTGIKEINLDALNSNITTVDLSSLKKGMYIVHLFNENKESIISKLVIE